MDWTHEENGGGLVSEENSMIQCERCEVEWKAMKGMDGRCKKSIECGTRYKKFYENNGL